MSTNQSLSRGLALLDAINESAQPLGIREVARLLQISPSIAQRLANSLMEAGYLQQEPETRKYRLGYRALALGSSMVRSDTLYVTASQELGFLAEHHQLNGYLGVIQQDAVVYLHTVQSHGAIAIRAEAGQRLAPHATALGKSLLAELPTDRAAAVLGPAPYPARTKQTITSARALQRELEETRRRGYSIADEENDLGVASIVTSAISSTPSTGDMSGREPGVLHPLTAAPPPGRARRTTFSCRRSPARPSTNPSRRQVLVGSLSSPRIPAIAHRTTHDPVEKAVLMVPGTINAR